MKNQLVLLLLCLSLSAKSQSYTTTRPLEGGFLFGLTNYSGDISEAPIEISETHLGFGAFMRYNFSEHFASKVHMYAGTISGDDKNSSVLRDRKVRFSTALVELGADLEYNLFSRSRMIQLGRTYFTPYLLVGIGMTFANAEAQYYGAPEDRDKYLYVPFPEDNLQTRFLLFPMGGGLRIDLTDRMMLGAEAGWRPVFSDDLDGVRQNGNPNSGDWYYFGGLTVSFVLNRTSKHGF